MKITILTLFPAMFEGVFSHSIIKRARDKKLLELNFVNIRDFGIGPHKVVDDTPYGGGVGMVIRVDVIEKALNSINLGKSKRVILTDPRGEIFSQKKARALSKIDHLIFICGHYEAIDERVTEMVDEKLSIGNYILTGGEIPTMVMVDATARLVKEVLSKEEATKFESFSHDFYLEHPHFTKPRIWRDKKVPEELLSGNHKVIEEWKKKNSHLASDTK